MSECREGQKGQPVPSAGIATESGPAVGHPQVPSQSLKGGLQPTNVLPYFVFPPVHYMSHLPQRQQKQGTKNMRPRRSSWQGQGLVLLSSPPGWSGVELRVHKERLGEVHWFRLNEGKFRGILCFMQ